MTLFVDVLGRDIATATLPAQAIHSKKHQAKYSDADQDFYPQWRIQMLRLHQYHLRGSGMYLTQNTSTTSIKKSECGVSQRHANKTAESITPGATIPATVIRKFRTERNDSDRSDCFDSERIPKILQGALPIPLYALSASISRFQVSRAQARNSKRQSQQQSPIPKTAPIEKMWMSGPITTAPAVKAAARLRYPRIGREYAQTFDAARFG